MCKTKWKYRNSDCVQQWKKKRQMASIWGKYPLSWPCLFYFHSKQQEQEYVQLYQFRPKKSGNEEKELNFFFLKIYVLVERHSKKNPKRHQKNNLDF